MGVVGANPIRTYDQPRIRYRGEEPFQVLATMPENVLAWLGLFGANNGGETAGVLPMLVDYLPTAHGRRVAICKNACGELRILTASTLAATPKQNAVDYRRSDGVIP